MGFLDFFTGGAEGQLKRHVKRVRNLNAQAEDRQASAYWLAENGSEEAIYGLLGRFGVTYEQGMKDAQEKELIRDLLLDLGPKVVEPIKKWVRKNQAFAIPLQVLEEIEGPGAVVDVLLDMMGREVDPFKPEKKRQILIKLAEYQDPRITERVPALLHDFDEGVRYAAVEALLAQEDEEAVRKELAQALANRQEESNRLRVRIAEAFQNRGWKLEGEQLEAVRERPPVGWVVEGDRIRPA